MVMFESKRVRALEKEVEELSEDRIRLIKENYELQSKVLGLFAFEGEFEKYLIDKLELDDLQASKLKLIFSIEKCRMCGIPEELIVQYDAWENSVQGSRES